MGLGHLVLTRKAKSLTTSEHQRLILLKFLSYKGSDALFVLDEPSLGLAQEEKEALWKSLIQLKDQGNTVLMIEHSPYFQEKADQYILMGPGAGNEGGEILFEGKFSSNKIKRFFYLPSGEI